MHEQLGHRRYKSNFFVPDYGYMIPSVNLLEDVDHLRQVRSPIWRLARKLNNSPESADWFAREFPDAATRYFNRQLITKEHLWQIIQDKLGRPPEKAINLFKGLSESEAMVCADAGHIVFCDQADVIVHPSDMSNEVFIVLNGTLVVRKQLAARRRSLSILRPGQIFGDAAVLAHSRQNVTLTAQTDTELLVLPRHGLERLQLQHPEIAAKFFRNFGVTDAQTHTYA
jgi:hypothetical protein